MTGDESITAIHIESAIQQCVTFITLNDTLQTTQPDMTNKLKSVCPSNCSNNGVCKGGSMNHKSRLFLYTCNQFVNIMWLKNICGVISSR